MGIRPLLRISLTIVLGMTAGVVGRASNTTGEPGEPVSLAIGETARIAELTVTLTGVDGDNRCPKSVQCLVGGEATVRLLVESADGSTTELNIDVPPDASARARSGSYSFEVDLEPETTAARRIEAEDYVATITVRDDTVRNDHRRAQSVLKNGGADFLQLR